MAKRGNYEKMKEVYDFLWDFDASQELLDFVSIQLEQIKKKNQCHKKIKES